MCTTIHYKGEWLENVSDMKRALGAPVYCESNTEAVIRSKGYDPDTFCLCPVDLEATAEKYGLRLENGWGEYSCDFVLLPTAPKACQI